MRLVLRHFLDRDDVRAKLPGAITYKLNRLMAVKGEVRQEWMRSTVPEVDYAATVFLLGLRLQR